MPKPLDLNRLARFEPQRTPVERRQEPAPEAERQSGSRWPSREPVQQTQISIKGPIPTLERFQAMCRDDRRTYADMLEILMNHFDAGRRP